MKNLFIIFGFILINLTIFSQNGRIKWTVSDLMRENDSCVINISALIDENWYLYGMNIEDGGPLPLLISFENEDEIITPSIIYDLSETHLKFDDFFRINVETISDKAEFKIVFMPKKGVENIVLIIDGQICSAIDGKCIAVYEKITITIN
jgi:hypothetical protein